MAEVNLTPELRFPEFDGEWEEKKLGNLASEVSYGIGSAAKPFDGLIKYLRITDINEKNNSFFPNPLTSPEGDIDEKYYLTVGDIVFARTGASVGKTYLYEPADGNLVYAGFLIKFSFKDNAKFIFYNTLRYAYFKWVSIMSMRSGQPGINAEEYKAYKLYIPQPDEQQKIASFLTAIDQRIQLLQKKKAKLEEYKKGVMQKLFSQDIRFKDEHGNDFPDWEEKRLGEIGATFNGLTGKTKVDFGEGKPYVQYMQIFSNSKINVEEFGLVKIEVNETQSKVQYGDVFFTTSSETPNEIGTASVMLDEVDEVYLNSFCFGFRPNSLTELVPDFSRYLFRSELFRRKIIKLAQGSTRFNMSKLELMKLQVLLPNEDEQNKIAAFLSSLDASIESLVKEIEGTTTFKKGLLQKMFV